MRSVRGCSQIVSSGSISSRSWKTVTIVCSPTVAVTCVSEPSGSTTTTRGGNADILRREGEIFRSDAVHTLRASEFWRAVGRGQCDSVIRPEETGQTIARVRELETIGNLLAGQGLFSGLDLILTIVFIFVLFSYSAKLAWIVVASIPFYLAIGFLVRPFLKEKIDEKFERGSYSQQLLVETVVVCRH